ncbi:SUKH-3 domain-containing protein [Myxococcus sp. AS-1-15]|uniref:SUKH-3 domain-containing protein n=1 Tax=Myxococcus TaxID=32 RepID=UPI001CBBA58B|nr:SUKH-3 domain-containing protein [Myxococcus sp. AS-1-15]MBZ4401750.1 SUKH-3 domain-containing protein [Myxococcus sp. AS-1-15]
MPGVIGSPGEEVMVILRAAGWTPERDVQVGEARTVLLRLGIAIHPAAERVLRSLGGLTLCSSDHRSLEFDAMNAINQMEMELLSYVRRYFAESACPVMFGNDMIFFVSESGRWMALHDQWTVYYILPGLDAVLRFALFVENELGRMTSLEGDMVPPGYGSDPRIID